MNAVWRGRRTFEPPDTVQQSARPRFPRQHLAGSPAVTRDRPCRVSYRRGVRDRDPVADRGGDLLLTLELGPPAKDERRLGRAGTREQPGESDRHDHQSTHHHQARDPERQQVVRRHCRRAAPAVG